MITLTTFFIRMQSKNKSHYSAFLYTSKILPAYIYLTAHKITRMCCPNIFPDSKLLCPEENTSIYIDSVLLGHSIDQCSYDHGMCNHVLAKDDSYFLEAKRTCQRRRSCYNLVTQMSQRWINCGNGESGENKKWSNYVEIRYRCIKGRLKGLVRQWQDSAHLLGTLRCSFLQCMVTPQPCHCFWQQH